MEIGTFPTSVMAQIGFIIVQSVPISLELLTVAVCLVPVAIVCQSIAVTIDSRPVPVECCAVIVFIVTEFLALPEIVIVSITLTTITRLGCARTNRVNLSYASRVASSVGAAKVMALRPKMVTRNAFAKYILLLK
jgi:hypothetical protein